MSTPSTSPQRAMDAPKVPCPRCRKPLVDPKGLGWCQACGYCQSLEDAPKQAAVETPQPNRMGATGSAVGTAPKWLWVMLLGIVLVAGATFFAGRQLRFTPLQRAQLATFQIGIGILIMFAGQLIGLLRIAPEVATLSFWDAVFPFRLYGFIFKHLPKTSLAVCAGSWGLTAIVAAAVCIGGLGHWFSYIPGNQKGPQNQAQKANSR